MSKIRLVRVGLFLASLLLSALLAKAQTRTPLPIPFTLPIAGDCSLSAYWQSRFTVASDVLEATRKETTTVLKEKNGLIDQLQDDLKRTVLIDSTRRIEIANKLSAERGRWRLLNIGRNAAYAKIEAELRASLPPEK